MSFPEIFSHMVAQKRVPNLFLLQGKESNKSTIALACARQLLASDQEYHPDLHHYYPEGRTGMHSLYMIKNLCRDIYLSSHNGGYRCFIIYDAERMLPSNANALLKTFEEPPKQCVIFLLTSRPALLLPTIVSRCQRYTIHNEGEEKKYPVEEKLLNVLAGISSPMDLIEIGDNVEKEREKKEAEAMKDLSKELSALEKERRQKEIEGRYSLEYKKKIESLFETILQFYHDLTLYHLKVPIQKLLFPHLVEQYKRLSVPDCDRIEQETQKARLAHDRGVKLHYCLEALLHVN